MRVSVLLKIRPMTATTVTFPSSAKNPAAQTQTHVGRNTGDC